jgi:hypothetical protein
MRLLLIALLTAPLAQSASPATRLLALPVEQGDHSIWGATGQDRHGHLWFGVSNTGGPPSSARLVEYDPTTDAFTARGHVVSELNRAGVLRPGEQQAKIHSRIVQEGEFLYFASMDESGENPDGSKLPTWGGHLWRISLGTFRWDHLLASPEALIALGSGGGHVYALGYFKHVLYRFDTRTSRADHVEVGSVDGHISRNLAVDRRGHAYVPRLRASNAADGRRRVSVELVEFDPSLNERRATPIAADHYLGRDNPTDAHGIVGLQTLADGSIAFTTHAGRLYLLVPPAPGGREPATVTDLGWIHPRGTSYPASLFTSDGRQVHTLARSANAATLPWEWVSCQPLAPLECRVRRLEFPSVPFDPTRAIFYGSSTRDIRGGHYVVGIANDRPVVVRIQP